MKGKLHIILLAVLVMTMQALYSYAGEGTSGDRTLSPYFFVKSDDHETDRLPLKSTRADVMITGVIADVKVTQVYRNEGKNPLEAIYVFPGSTKAAIYAMKMTIGERVINAEIKKRDDARQIYENAKNQGKSASLLEQHRPNVFQMNVVNIMPGEEIKTELSYTELIVPTDKTYEFIYPTVVGPRYSNMPAETAPESEKWVANPYLREGEEPTYDFDIKVRLAAGLPLSKLLCTSHKVDVKYIDPSTADITLDSSEGKGGNRDYIMKYRLDSDKIETGLLLYKGKDENFFLLIGQPPKRITQGQIPGREYIFIVDVSGSMHGFPLEISKKLLKDLIGNLKPTDMFNVVLFAGSSSVMSKQSLPAVNHNIQKAITVIENQRGGGGTELLQALQTALSLPRTKGYSRSVVIATDGYVTVEEQSFDLIRKNLGEANMFAFGIGSSVNHHIIEGMSFVGQGEPFVITKPEEAPAKAEQFRKMIEFPVLTNIAFDFKGFDVYDVEPPSVPDILAERPLVVFGKWKGKAKGKITITGMTGKGEFTDSVNVAASSPDAGNSALRYLWARYRIKLLSDYNSINNKQDRIAEITGLGLKYNLLTGYTSFVAVDTVIRNKTGRIIKSVQPLPLPEGVSNYAVGEQRMPASKAAQAPFSSGRVAFEEVKKVETVAEDRASSIVLKELKAKGPLSLEDARKAVEGRISELTSCGALQEEVTLVLTVDKNGKITNMKPVTKGKAVNIMTCITETVKKWLFTASAGNTEIRMTIALK